MTDPYVVTTWDGYCAGCGEKLRFHSCRWAHRRCAATLCRHRQPFVTKDYSSVWVARMFTVPSRSPSTESETPA